MDWEKKFIIIGLIFTYKLECTYMSNKGVNLIIHGHFYQPPREDPWTNEIDNQQSAYPFNNWNFRIARECYGPNAFSRVLDNQGKILEIINNYEFLSFNFGPTLLSWMQKKDKDTYNKIIEADKKSVASHNGHGNAIAQVYNHVIMPLASFEDKKTQIIWGLKDFEKRFGRKSEGIWLAETACDYKTIDILIELGIKFIILSPLQAASFRKIGDSEWRSCKNTPIKSTFPYIINRSHGSIGVFYYDKELSTAISFEHLLHDSNNFANKIIHHHLLTKDDDALIVATDGEIYGHHEPFGDMCLSSLIYNYSMKSNQIRFMNFGEYLEAFPPQYETEISLGDDNLGSSWSCAHGVGRWYRDCGCHTGGEAHWNQKWRKPLREAYDIIKSKIDQVYVDSIGGLIDDPWHLRNDYIECLNDSPIDLIIEKHSTGKITEQQKKKIIKLLEMQKYSLFMYTSCAWFFTELSGIETVQTMKYAYKALSLLDTEDFDEIKENFEQKMKEAKSNIPEFKNGLWILKNWVYSTIHNNEDIANNYIALKNFTDIPPESNRSFFLFNNFTFSNFKQDSYKNSKTIFTGEITVEQLSDHEKDKLYFVFDKSKSPSYKVFIFTDKQKSHEVLNNLQANNANIYKDKYSGDVRMFTEQDLLSDIKQEIVAYEINESIEAINQSSVNLIDNAQSILSKYKIMRIPLPEEIKSFTLNIVEIYLHEETVHLKTFPDQNFYASIRLLFQNLNSLNLRVKADSFKNKISDILLTELSNVDDPFSEVFNKAVELIKFCNDIEIQIEKSKIENKIFHILKTDITTLIDRLDDNISDEDKLKSMLQLRKIIMLAEIFNINTEQEKKHFFNFFNEEKL